MTSKFFDKKLGHITDEEITESLKAANKKANADKPVHARPSLYAYYFEQLKIVAQKKGYCLLLHGSMNRDLDLVAVPWKNGAHACDIKKMIDEMAEVLGSNDIMPPHKDAAYGRQQWVINVDRGGYFKEKVNGVPNYAPDPQYYIDISVFEASQPAPVSEPSQEEISDAYCKWAKSYDDKESDYPWAAAIKWYQSRNNQK